MSLQIRKWLYDILCLPFISSSHSSIFWSKCCLNSPSTFFALFSFSFSTKKSPLFIFFFRNHNLNILRTRCCPTFSFSLHLPEDSHYLHSYFFYYLLLLFGQCVIFSIFNLVFFQPDCCQFQMCHSWPQLLFISVGKRKVMEKWKTF